MNKIPIVIPYGIEYIGQYKEYSIPRGEHCIVDKGVTGCGYTEFALRNDDPLVLCSPRKLLLENKSEKHAKEGRENVLYLDGISQERMYIKVQNHLALCKEKGLTPKFLITYDSTKKIVECLRYYKLLGDFIFVVDEFQSIFLDSYFKVGVEFDFVRNLQECPNVVYLSATPMLDKYLIDLDEFKNLPFYEMNWKETGYVETINIGRKRTNSLTAECVKIVKDYLHGNFPMMTNKNNKVIQSKEAVFYFNSIAEILRIVRKCGLTPKNTIIICSNSEKNEKKLKKEGFTFGKIPLEGEINPMFTFCTSAVYMGVDFISDCASSYVFADPNVECLALDISLDLPQIIGRQRNKANPFKNYIALFYKTKRMEDLDLTEENFKDYENKKREDTLALLNIFDKLDSKEQGAYVKKLVESIEYSNYKGDFISISETSGKPVYNKLIEIADRRAWDVTRKDYQDTISVTKTISELKNLEARVMKYKDREEMILSDFLDNHFYASTYFHERMKMYCEFRKTYQDDPIIMEGLINRITDTRFHQYYNYYGPDGCSARKYVDSELKKGWEDSTKEDKLKSFIYSYYNEGDRVSKSDIKSFLKGIYSVLSLSKTAKATDLGEYFEMSKTNVVVDGVSKNGFKLGRRLK